MEDFQLLGWAKDLFPLNRSLSGEGVRDTLAYFKNLIPELQINAFQSGTRAFDWILPDEWNVKNAYIETSDGRRVAQMSDHNLHLVGYSEPVNRIVEKPELLEHLHFLPTYPNAIPYVTSYYERNWGFCVNMEQFRNLGDGPFHVVIDSTFKSGEQGGVLNYGEIFFPGKTSQEVLFSTYICHPSMANNELSGPVVAAALAKYVSKIDHHYSYRFLFLPETIGAIAYLGANLSRLKDSVIAGWVLTCLGDSGAFSYIPSRLGNTHADKVSKSVLAEIEPAYTSYTWLDRVSDERQYCAPGVDLPICTISRTKPGSYNEYHSSSDDLSFISAQSLFGSFQLFQSLVEKLEKYRVPKIRTLCEPQLGKRNLYPNLSTREGLPYSVQNLTNVISYLDGKHTLEEIAGVCGLTTFEVNEYIKILITKNLIDI